MSTFVRRRNATDVTCHERVYHWQAECWDVPFAHLHDVTTIQQALGCQNMHGFWKLDTSQSARCLPIHQSTFGMFWIVRYGNVSRIPEMPINSALPFKQSGTIFHSCHNRQPGVQAMYCTARCHWRTYQLLNCEFRHMSPYVLIVLFVIVHLISVCKILNSVT